MTNDNTVTPESDAIDSLTAELEKDFSNAFEDESDFRRFSASMQLKGISHAMRDILGEDENLTSFYIASGGDEELVKILFESLCDNLDVLTSAARYILSAAQSDNEDIVNGARDCVTRSIECSANNIHILEQVLTKYAFGHLSSVATPTVAFTPTMSSFARKSVNAANLVVADDFSQSSLDALSKVSDEMAAEFVHAPMDEE